ncbi:MAG: hypothetical protein JXR91_10305 [Deltaproteobacteria bacterium]|nr:hypothetical protein [Deltaproteobacteria bacterium]
MKISSTKFALFGSFLVFITFSIFADFVKDPVLSDSKVTLQDNRRHRLGSLTFERTSKIINELELEIYSQNSVTRESAYIKLVEIYYERRMFKESVDWLEKGLKAFPQSKTLAGLQDSLNKTIYQYKMLWD